MTERTVEADGFRCAVSSDGKMARLSFTSKKDVTHIVMPVPLVQTVVGDIENAALGIDVRAIDPAELAKSQSVKITGRNVRAFASGERQLVLFLDVDGRTRKIATTISAADAANLIADLT